MKSPTILIVGTVDTKSDEINFIHEQVLAAGGQSLIMDVGVLAKGRVVPNIANTEVAMAAGVTLQQVMTSGDENSAMALMAKGASKLASQLQQAGRMDGLLVLGGTMGTDLALDVASSLPLGVPKVVLSTVAFSPLLPPERMPPDLMMVLWAGGLYGLNSLCQSALAQAAGAVVGACRVARAPKFERPVVGMTSLGSSCLKYMLQLQPELHQRGFDLAVFHTTGMGGRAFESLAAHGQFACVMDFSLQEMINQMGGSIVSAGSERLMGAGLNGVPMIVAPGATDLVDYPAWGKMPERFVGRSSHEHNRLIASVGIDANLRREFAQELVSRLSHAKGPVHLVLPELGIEEWDRPGAPMHDPEGLAAMMDEFGKCHLEGIEVSRIQSHINDPEFVQQVLVIFDDWVDRGLVKKVKQ